MNGRSKPSVCLKISDNFIRCLPAVIICMQSKLNTWQEADRPREKFRSKGAHVLTHAELLAIVIRSGNRQDSALGLAHRLLDSVDGRLEDLGKLSLEELQTFPGVGLVKAISIQVVFEWALRLQVQKRPILPKIRSSKQVFLRLQLTLGPLEHEEFWALYLNNANRVLGEVQLSKGGITGTVVDIRITMRKAIQFGAVALILAHNHPSGTLKPSEADIRLTERMVHAAEALDLKVLDHLIITEKAYFSFADQQML